MGRVFVSRWPSVASHNFMHRRQFLYCLYGMGFWSYRPSTAWGQTREPSTPDRPPTVRVDVDLVLLEAHITDRKGQPVYLLKADDFRIYEDGVLQKVA